MTDQQTPLFDAPRSPALVHVARAARLAHAFHDAACARSGHRFNRTDTRAILDLVTRRPVGTMTTLGKSIGLSRAAVTTLVDRLEGFGYVTSKPDPDDRRRILLDPTGAACRLVVHASTDAEQITDEDTAIECLCMGVAGARVPPNTRPCPRHGDQAVVDEAVA